MPHVEVTPQIVAQVERMLAARRRVDLIAAKLGITRYVVEVIARDDECRAVEPPRARQVRYRSPNAHGSIDATTIRMIQRMLAVGILGYGEIARQAGVSSHTVNNVATGKRLAVTGRHRYLQPGERGLASPIRCPECRGLIAVIPCRACRTREEAATKKSVCSLK